MNSLEKIAELLKYDPYREWRGGSLQLIQSTDPEVLLVGPAETGKTWAACYKSHMLCREYPGAQGALIRKVAASIPGTVFLTMKKIIGEFPVKFYGGDTSPECIIYPNKSKIWIGGMDNPAKALSGERDFIQVCQAEEFNVNDWEVMTTRCTGRGAVMPYAQLFGDCNPGGQNHFLRSRSRLKMLPSIHLDNPSLYTTIGEPTPQGLRTMETLNNLTGLRRKRLLEGLWASAEGAVYDFTPEHVKHREKREFQYCLLALDEGYTNPAVILVIGIDADLRLHVLREFYQTGVLQSDVVKTAWRWAHEFHVSKVIVDAAAAGLIAELASMGLDVEGHKGRVIDGIHLVQDLLKVSGDGKPRLTVEPDCVNTINEFESYVWKPGKDEPVKANDHACLVAGTLITTQRGLVPIEQVSTQDKVLTRTGWSKVLWSGCTNPAAEVYQVHLSTRTLTGTANHPVFVNGALERLDSIKRGDVVTCQDAQDTVLEVVKAGITPVYNLTVADHEYFANGILCHNCDALRYLTHWLFGEEEHTIERVVHDPVKVGAF